MLFEKLKQAWADWLNRMANQNSISDKIGRAHV